MPQETATPKWAVQAPDGKVIQFPDSFTDADVSREMGKLYPQAPQPNAAQRYSEITLGTQHPLDELKAEGKNIIAHPKEAAIGAAQSLGETLGIPKDFWAHPGDQFQNIGGTGIPGMIFGENGLIKSPLKFAENFTGGTQSSDDLRSGNYKAIPGDIAGGLTNLALAKKPIEAGGAALADTAKNAKAGIADAVRTPENKLTPTAGALSRVGTAAFGYGLGVPLEGSLLGGGVFGKGLADAFLPKRPETPNFFGGAYNPFEGESSAPVPITKSPYFDSAAYRAGRSPSTAPIRTTPFAGATSSATSTFNSPLPEVSAARPQPKVAGINATPAEVESGIKGSVAKPSGRLILSPEEARAESAMQSIATKRASQHGMLYAAGMRPAGGGRVPMTATPTETFEYPQRSAYEPPADEQYSRTGGAEGPYAPPDYAYRAHDAGNYDIDLGSHAHATESEAEAQTYAQSRNAGTPQQVSKINLGKVGQEGYEVREGPNGKKWYKFKRPLTSGDYE